MERDYVKASDTFKTVYRNSKIMEPRDMLYGKVHADGASSIPNESLNRGKRPITLDKFVE